MPEVDDGIQRGGGSVKRARQRARAGIAPQQPGFGNESIPRQMPQPFAGPIDHPQYPQYPMQAGRQTSAPPIRPGQPPARNNSPTRNNPLGRGPPPQRPPRPNYVPLMPSQTFNQPPQPNYWEDSYMVSPGRDGNLSSSSGRSTSSSAASIPDFPVPAIPVPLPQPQRRAANLGPPPSARKGGANYYPQNSFVTPIPEEQSEAHNSFASSHVFPTSWGDGPPGYYTGKGIDEEEEGSEGSPAGDQGRESRASDRDESTELVRKVSIGKPGRPALKSVKGGGAENGDANFLKPNPFDDRQQISDGRPAGGVTFLSASSANDSAGTPNEILIGLSRSTPSPGNRSPRSPTSPLDPRVTEILGGLEKAGALDSSGTASPITPMAPSTSEKELKRPPPLNLEAAQAGEGRGSSTSLPELIRRATRLASNLDRGRTASRVGMLNILNDRAGKSGHGSRTGSISEMLNAFPSPSVRTPTGEKSRWPSPLPKSNLSRTQTFTPNSPTRSYPKSNTRRCCGMPIWAFSLLCIILLLLVAAAVVIPITIIVLPKQNSKSRVIDLTSCRKALACANGGSNYFVSNSCRCICANGYTGVACTTATDSGCITSDVKAGDQTNNVYTNATIGSSLARLLSGGPLNYSIPLTPAIILSLFSNTNFTCTSQNALVTFNQKSQRRDELPLLYDLPQLNLNEDVSLPESTPSLTNKPTIQPRATSSSIAIDTTSLSPVETTVPATMTSNSIIFAAGGAPSPATATGAAAASATSSSSSSSSGSSNHAITQQILDFARVAVLFVYQETNLTSAFITQNSLQQTLMDASGFNASKTSAGGGVVVDFGRWTVDLGNGTLFGGGKGAALGG